MSITDQIYDAHGDRDKIAAIIRRHTNNHVGADMCRAIADEIMSVQIDQPERDNERRLTEIALAEAEKRTILAEVRLASDNHKRKMYFLERGVVGIALQTVFGNIHERRGVFNLMTVMAFVCLIVLVVTNG